VTAPERADNKERSRRGMIERVLKEFLSVYTGILHTVVATVLYKYTVGVVNYCI
jgi:hypothetical protein